MKAGCCQFDTNRSSRASARAEIARRLHEILAKLGTCALLAGAFLILPTAAHQSAPEQTARQAQPATPQRSLHSPTVQPAPKGRMLTKAEERSIINAAWQQAQPVASSQDCSHLVHEIYSAAGYEFPYATSFALYAGNPNFARVKHPQPGDVIAWPGHVGIVVNPGKHSFFSLVRSGAEEEDYTSLYWRSRGRARFYRFLVTNSVHPPATRKVSVSARSPQDPDSLTPRDAVDRHAEAASIEEKPPVGDASEHSFDVPVSDPPPTFAHDSGPVSIPVAASERNPTREEVANAITGWSKSSAEVLRASEPLKILMPIIIFDTLTVDRVRIKGDRGSIELRIDSGVLLNSDGVDFKQRHEKLRWELRRDPSGWVARTPPERAYVPRDLAVRIFAAQLAQLTESDSASAHDQTVLGQEARLANLLSALLQNR